MKRLLLIAALLLLVAATAWSVPVEAVFTPTDFHVPHNTLSNTGNEGYAKLIDQNKSTKWCVVNNSGAWETIWLDVESDVLLVPNSYILTTANDTKTNPTRNPKEWVLYGKTLENDQWTELAHVTDGGGLQAVNTTDYTFPLIGITQGYRYFRFEVRQINGKDPADNNYTFQLAELMLSGTKVMDPENYEPALTPTNFHVPHNTLSNTGNEGYAKLIDRKKSTKWCVVNKSGAWETIWLDFKTDVMLFPKSYTLTTGNDTQNSPTRNPKEWVLYGKTLENDEWTELSHVTDGGGLQAVNTTDYTFPLTGINEGYHYFRFEVRQINGKDPADNNYTFQLAELTLIGTQDPENYVPTLIPTDFHVSHNTLSNTGNEGFAKLIDQDKSTKWCVVNNSGAWETIWLDFKADELLFPKSYILTTGNDTQNSPTRNPKEWVLYGKTLENDEWTELAHVTDGGGLQAVNTTDYTFPLTGITQGCRYFRFEVRQINDKDPADNYYTFQLAELTLIGTLDPPTPPAPPALPFDPTTNPSLSTTMWYQITIDGQYLFYNSSNGYLNASSSSSTDDNYFWCFVGDESTGYKIYNRGHQAYMSKGFYVSGSGDEAYLNYVELDSEDNFYIYYMNGTQKHYLAYSSVNGVYTSNNQRSGCRALAPIGPPLPNLPGDLNGDGQVDIADVNAVINMMLGKVSATPAGDVTGDDSVDIADVNAVINIMLGKTQPSGYPTPHTLTATGFNVPHNGLDNNGDEGYTKLVDGNKSTKWCVENRTGAWETIWIDLKSEVAFRPTSYILTTGNDTNTCPTRNPKNWKIYGRNSESESWTELVHVTDGAQAGLGTENTTDYTFQFSGISQAYKYYRFEVIENSGADKYNAYYYIFQLAELTLVGLPQ